MIGVNATTGKPISGLDRLSQAVKDILLTPLGSRVGRREYGSLLSELIDQPVNATTRIRLFAATALALLRWEPELKLTKVALEQIGPGSFALALEGDRLGAGTPNARIRLTVPLRQSGSLIAFA